MSKSNKIINIVIVTTFVLVIFLYGVLNLKSLFNSVNNTLSDTTITLQTKTRKIEQEFTESLVYRDYLIDFYGITQKILCKSIIGNFEFIKSSNEFMHMAVNDINISPLVESIWELNKILDQKNIPLIYVQVPPRSLSDTQNHIINISHGEDVAIHDAKQTISSYGIMYLDISEKMAQANFPPDKFFFKTDVHLTTEGEFFLAKEIINALQDIKVSFEREDVNKILNINNYNIDSRLFLGNLSRSTGKYYSEIDVFDNYSPKFQVSVSMDNWITGERREGGFEDVFMNNYSNMPYITERTYWITNYLQFGQSYYESTNNSQEQNKLLIICDSMGMRAIPLLSLLANKVTIVDIRFQGLNTYALNALNVEEYDAVIVLHENSLFNYKIVADILESPDARIISHDTPTSVVSNGTYSFDITVQNTSSDFWSEQKQVRLCIWQDGQDHGYRLYLPEGVEVAPGEQYTFRLENFRCTSGQNTYLEFIMCQEGITYFGEKERVDIAIVNE